MSPAKKFPHILLTNDDGYDAPGLKALAAVLEGWATVSIVAPNGEKSGAAQSLTLRQPIVCHPKGERHWAVDGTPADAVIVALHKLLPEKPDLVISGINHGANMGENVITPERSARRGRRRCITFRRLRCRFAREGQFAFCACGEHRAECGGNYYERGIAGPVLLSINVPERGKAECSLRGNRKRLRGINFRKGKIRRGGRITGFLSRRLKKTWSRIRIMRRCLRGRERDAVASGPHA